MRACKKWLLAGLFLLPCAAFLPGLPGLSLWAQGTQGSQNSQGSQSGQNAWDVQNSQNSQNVQGASGLQMPSMPAMPAMSGSSLNMPSISAPAAPTAPSISSPSSNGNGGFYVPGFQTSANGRTNAATGTASDAAADENEKGQTDSAQASAASKNQSSSALAAKDLAASLAKNNLLSSADISSLYDSGMFSSISGLVGAANLSSNAALSAAPGVNSDEVMLKKILDKLEELKDEQDKLSLQKKQELSEQQEDISVFRIRDPKILRFKINGYNIADSISSAFFSTTEADGSFLLTGDRTYYLSGKPRTETFYLLFKAVRSNGSAVTFDVIPSIVQDSENVNSFVYRFSKMQELCAQKTGNLVALHSSSEGLNVDLLLDIDGEQ